jgi:hypothetical protein
MTKEKVKRKYVKKEINLWEIDHEKMKDHFSSRFSPRAMRDMLKGKMEELLEDYEDKISSLETERDELRDSIDRIEHLSLSEVDDV